MSDINIDRLKVATAFPKRTKGNAQVDLPRRRRPGPGRRRRLRVRQHGAHLCLPTQRGNRQVGGRVAGARKTRLRSLQGRAKRLLLLLRRKTEKFRSATILQIEPRQRSRSLLRHSCSHVMRVTLYPTRLSDNGEYRDGGGPAAATWHLITRVAGKVGYCVTLLGPHKSVIFQHQNAILCRIFLCQNI